MIMDLKLPYEKTLPFIFVFPLNYHLHEAKDTMTHYRTNRLTCNGARTPCTFLSTHYFTYKTIVRKQKRDRHDISTKNRAHSRIFTHKKFRKWPGPIYYISSNTNTVSYEYIYKALFVSILKFYSHYSRCLISSQSVSFRSVHLADYARLWNLWINKP